MAHRRGQARDTFGMHRTVKGYRLTLICDFNAESNPDRYRRNLEFIESMKRDIITDGYKTIRVFKKGTAIALYAEPPSE